MSLSLLEAGQIHTVFLNTFPIWTTGTLFLSTVYRGFVWAGPPPNTTLSGVALSTLASLRGAVSQQDLLFKAWDGVPGAGMRHRVPLQPPSGCAAICRHVVLALAGLGECDVIKLSVLPVFIFWPSSSIPQGVTCLICWLQHTFHTVLVTGEGDGVFSAVWVWWHGLLHTTCILMGMWIQQEKPRIRKKGDCAILALPSQKVSESAQIHHPSPFSVPLNPVEWTPLALAEQKQLCWVQNPS